MPPDATSGINPSFPGLSQTLRQVPHVLRTRSPLSSPCIAALQIPLDLHVLTTSPAFTLSQDQTLQKSFFAKDILRRAVQILTIRTYLTLQNEHFVQNSLFSFVLTAQFLEKNTNKLSKAPHVFTQVKVFLNCYGNRINRTNQMTVKELLKLLPSLFAAEKAAQ